MITLDELTDRLPLLTGAVFAVGFILFILTLRMFRHSRGARYWIHRRRAGQRGFRMLVLSMLFLSLSFGLCIATFIFNAIEDSDGDMATQVAAVSTITQPTITPPLPSATASDAPTDTPTATLTETATQTNTATLTATAINTPTLTQQVTEIVTEAVTEATVISQAINTVTTRATRMPILTLTLTVTQTASPTPSVPPTSTPSFTSTAIPTATTSDTATYTASPTQSPTATQSPSNTPTATEITPTATPSHTPLPTLPVSVINITPRATPAENALLALSAIAEGIENGEAVDEGETFSSGIRRIYFFIDYQAMSTGVLWRWQLSRDEQPIASRALLWGPAGNGESYFFVGQQGGFSAGDYELQLFIGDLTEPIDSATFTVTP